MKALYIRFVIFLIGPALRHLEKQRLARLSVMWGDGDLPEVIVPISRDSTGRLFAPPDRRTSG
jgi:hypothetical protein